LVFTLVIGILWKIEVDEIVENSITVVFITSTLRTRGRSERALWKYCG